MQARSGRAHRADSLDVLDLRIGTLIIGPTKQLVDAKRRNEEANGKARNGGRPRLPEWCHVPPALPCVNATIILIS